MTDEPARPGSEFVKESNLRFKIRDVILKFIGL